MAEKKYTVSKAELEQLSPPGDTIKECLKEKDMSIETFAEYMHIPLTIAIGLISGNEPISHITACQLHSLFGVDAAFWMNREFNYQKKLIELLGAYHQAAQRSS